MTDQITTDELRELFGDGIPIAVIQVISQGDAQGKTTAQIREEVRALVPDHKLAVEIARVLYGVSREAFDVARRSQFVGYMKSMDDARKIVQVVRATEQATGMKVIMGQDLEGYSLKGNGIELRADLALRYAHVISSATASADREMRVGGGKPMETMDIVGDYLAGRTDENECVAVLDSDIEDGAEEEAERVVVDVSHLYKVSQ